MTEHIPPLTEKEVAEIEAHIDAAEIGDSHLFEVAYAAPRLLADWRAMRRLLVELTADYRLGILYAEAYKTCMYCGEFAKATEDIAHAPDCPILRGRALMEP